MKNKKSLTISILLVFICVSCISVEDLVGKNDSVEQDAVDEVGQLLADIQQEESDLIENQEDSLDNLADSDERLPPSPTKEYDSALIDEEEETEEAEPKKEKIVSSTETSNQDLVNERFREVQNEISKLSINDKLQYRVATINFYSGSSRVDGVGLKKIKSIAKIAKERNAKIKVVGHASKRTRDMPLAKHKLVNFAISDKRAQSVANVFIKQHNFPSSSLITEAVSDTKPLFKENMPAGTKANQRTEIFLIY